jgi:hypothetical protein
MLGCYHASAGKISRPRGGGNRRIASVGAGAQLRVAACRLHMLLLRRGDRDVMLMRCRRFL